MLYNTKKTHNCAYFLKLLSIIFFVCLSSCSHGFYEPITLNVDLPEGPPEYKSGFRAGCRSGLGTRSFSNAFVYKPDYGTGIYQHDERFIDGWRHGWFSCVIHAATFTQFGYGMGNGKNYMPLEGGG